MAPLPELITPLGWEFINSLPPVLRDDPTYRAIMHCGAKECEHSEERIEYLRAQLNPLSANAAGLAWWERLLRLSGSGTEEQRRIVASARLRALDGDPSGTSWQSRLSDRLGGIPWTYEEHDEVILTSPPAQTLRFFLPYEPDSPAWDKALVIVRDETPSELDLEFQSLAGFTLDVDALDIDTLGI